MKYLILFLIAFSAIASDNIIVASQSGSAYFKDNGGNLMPLTVAYSTDGSGNLKIINSNNPVDDTIIVPPNTGKMYLQGADNKLYPASVLYSTDGNGNVSPILPPSWGVISGTLSAQADLQSELNSKLNTSGGVMSGAISMGGNLISNVGPGASPNDVVTKTQLDSLLTGLIWQNPISDPDLADDSLCAPPLGDYHSVVFIIQCASPTGDWAPFYQGAAVQLHGGSWKDLYGRPVASGDSFGVELQDKDAPLGGSIIGQGDKIAIVNGGASGSYTYTFLSPQNNWAVFSTENSNSDHSGQSYTYSNDLSQWVQFGGPAIPNVGQGLSLNGYVMNVNVDNSTLAINGSNQIYALTSLPQARSNYTNFVDQGIVIATSSYNAYYPSVIYDQFSFGTPGGPKFKMWFGNGGTAEYNSTSVDGYTWTTPIAISGISSDGYHNQVVYDSGCFGSPSCTVSDIRYKIYYWKSGSGTCISGFGYAESADGLTWVNDQTITQDPSAQLITCVGGQWNGASNGPSKIFFQPFAKNIGTYPFDYTYAMYYDVSTGTQEATAAAYSIDGKFWHVYGSAPVIPYSGSGWDQKYATYVGLLKDASGVHAWYSGGINGANEGIGYATSLDSLNFTKWASNPIFTITGAPSYRNARTYTPTVVDDNNHTIFMYYSALSTAGGAKKQIGLATLSY